MHKFNINCVFYAIKTTKTTIFNSKQKKQAKKNNSPPLILSYETE